MEEAKHDESKAHSQLERLTCFTDGVMSIAITLLVIEIKVPEITVLKDISDNFLLQNLSHTAFKFIGFLISFGIIGHYWSVHHRIFGYVKRYTSTLFWVNLIFLLSVVILPFSSGLLGEYSTHMEMNVPYTIYVINMVFTGLANCLLWIYVSDPKRDLLTRKISKSRIKLGLYRSVIIPLVFIVSLVISFFLPITARFIPVLIPFALHWGMKGLEKSANLQEAPIDDAS